MRNYTGPKIKTERLLVIAPARLWQMDSGDCIAKLREQIMIGLERLKRNETGRNLIYVCRRNYGPWGSVP